MKVFLLCFFLPLFMSIFMLPKALQNNESDWWKPIADKHHLKADQSKSFDEVHMMGSEITSQNRITEAKNAIILMTSDSLSYRILKAPAATYDSKKEILTSSNGTLKTYLYSTNDTTPVKVIPFIHTSIHFD